VGRLTPNPKIGNETGVGIDGGRGGAGAAAESVLQKNHLRSSPSSTSSSSSQADEDAEASTRARCLFARHLLPSLRTPVFSFLSRYDGAQAASFACLPEPEEEVEAQNAVGEMVIKAFKVSVEASSVKHGYLIDACARHCFWEQFSSTLSVVGGGGIANVTAAAAAAATTTAAAAAGAGAAAVSGAAATSPAASPSFPTPSSPSAAGTAAAPATAAPAAAASKEEVVIDAEHPRVINAWTNVKGPSGRTAAELFMAWYEGEGGVEEWREERTERYPCLECCGG